MQLARPSPIFHTIIRGGMGWRWIALISEEKNSVGKNYISIRKKTFRLNITTPDPVKVEYYNPRSR